MMNNRYRTILLLLATAPSAKLDELAEAVDAVKAESIRRLVATAPAESD